MRDLNALARKLTREDIEALEIGSAIMGTGGGGNPYVGKLRALQAIKEGYELRLLALEDLPDDAKVMSLGGIGAPVVSHERIKEGREGLRGLRALEDRLGVKVDAVACEEIGGQNSMEPLITAAFAGLPVVDGDGMGRAFPEMQMTTYSIYGHRSTPSAMCDPHGNVVIFDHAVTELWHERMARACVVAQGGASTLCSAPMSGAYMKKFAIPHSYTKAMALGHAVLNARAENRNPVEAVCAAEDGTLVFTGKITDLKRELKGGFVRGEAILSGFDDYEGQNADIHIQNEFLIFRLNGEIKVIVPDLIVVLDHDDGGAISTEMLRYGQRVSVVAIPSHPLLRTPEAIEVVGPKGFGFENLAFDPMEGQT